MSHLHLFLAGWFWKCRFFNRLGMSMCCMKKGNTQKQPFPPSNWDTEGKRSVNCVKTHERIWEAYLRIYLLSYSHVCAEFQVSVKVVHNTLCIYLFLPMLLHSKTMFSLRISCGRNSNSLTLHMHGFRSILFNVYIYFKDCSLLSALEHSLGI